MALADLTKQLAQQAILSATSGKEKEKEKEPSAPAADPTGPVIFGQIAAMQKALKEDEELLVFFESGAERIRVLEMFLASPQVVVLTGRDPHGALSRVVSAVDVLQLICKTTKVQPGGKPQRVALLTPKPKDSSGS